MDLEHEKRLTEVEARSKSNAHRLDEVEKRQDDHDALLFSVKELAIREQNVENDVKEIKGDVKEIKDKPGKRWDSVIDKIIFTIVGGIVSYILIKLGF